MKRKITSNVLEDISKRLGGESLNDDRALIVFTGSNIGLDKRLEDIKALKYMGMKMSVAFSFMADKLLDTNKIINLLSPYNVYKEEDIFKLQSISRAYPLIIGPNITINTLSKVSLGLIDSFIPNLIWTGLYLGGKVYLDFTSVREYLGEETQNKEIQKILQSYIDNVIKMGVIEIKQDNYHQIIGTGEINSKTIDNKNIIQDKKVITESDILNLNPNNKLLLPKGSIITPLAKDKAREKNIQIEIKGG